MGFDGAIVQHLPRRGLNNGLDAINLPDDFSPDCENVRFRFGSVQKRDGHTRYISTASTAAPVTGLAQLVLTDGTTQQVVTAGADIFRENASAWTSIKGAVSLTSGPNNHFQFAQLQDILYGVNDVDAVIQWTGTGNISTVGGAPDTARAIITFKNRLVALNVVEGGNRNRGRVRWSDLNDGATWGVASTQTFLNKQGDEGVGLAKLRDQLFVFFQRSIHQMADTGDSNVPFVFPTLVPNIGSISGNAIVPVDDQIFFPSYRGIYSFDGSGVRYVSQPIEATWRTINTDRLAQIIGFLNEKFDEVWFAISTGSGTQNTVVLAYDYVHDIWTRYTGMSINAAMVWRQTIPLNPVWGDYVGIVQKSNSGAYLDDTTAITGYCNSKPMDLGGRQRYRKVRRIELIADTSATASAILKTRHAYELGTLSNEAEIDITVAGAVWDTAIFDTDVFATEGQKILRHYPQGNGRWFQYQLRSDQASVGMNVSGVNLFVKGEGIQEVR